MNKNDRENTRRFPVLLGYSLIAASMVVGLGPARALAQQDHRHENRLAENDQTSSQSDQINPLIRVVRQATERFQDVSVAQAAGYSLQFGCVTGPDFGAMGMHFINGALVNDGQLDAMHPEILVYEPLPNGGLRLIGADYLVFADAWNATHTEPPQLMGQLFHLFESPNRFGLPAFYTLHVWAWKHNPTGAFTNWHSNVSCKAFNGQHQ